MSDRTWSFLGYFFTVTIIVGVLGTVIYADKNNLEPFFGNTTFKYVSIIYCLVGVFFIVHSEIRKRVKTVSFKTVGTTIVVILVIFGYLALTRL
ncbi:hypothetical protein ACFFF5_10765 [Lederbergia wuyishanensis]|uniref:Glucan phosphoethanolaminetransferase (Alkaline phosphatase superfamily) n=1 Tax=Lederbergia wuyishanensis TaxID=1347903 RepID=A0ABU0D6U9_9BACI|nr:hypothetical protein [Lederbergia wuyishanensis]MCJ8008763.1 hypothetical protein [Lederbergia wuyishanensis]MDQ0344083.1 glucan phosphoethanolaminetransferase (alkaline phosphatase superfamily) [Lederbergia wuyishanensis]